MGNLQEARRRRQKEAIAHRRELLARMQALQPTAEREAKHSAASLAKFKQQFPEDTHHQVSTYLLETRRAEAAVVCIEQALRLVEIDDWSYAESVFAQAEELLEGSRRIFAD